MSSPSPIWTGEATAFLREQWPTGKLTATRMAADLTALVGVPVTKGAVLGKCWRLGIVRGGPARRARNFAPSKPAETSAKPQHPPGAWPIADLGERQCRFACTPFDAPSHRFCGAPTKAGPGNLHGSWCEAHLPLVWGQGTRAERGADRLPKQVRMAG